MDPLRAPAWELGGVVALIAVYLTQLPYIDLVGPVVLMVLLLAGAVRMVFVSANAVWSSLFWFRLATAVYFGLGNIMPTLANATTRFLMDAYFFAQPEHLATLNLLVATSVFCVLGTASLLTLLWPDRGRQQVHDPGKLLLIGLMFAIFGYSMKFLVIVPMTLGLYGNAIIPGILNSLSLMAPVSVYMLGRYAVLYRASLLPVVVALVVSDVLVGVLLMNKSDVILSIIMFFMAYLSQRPTLVKCATAAAVVAGTLMFVTPVAEYGRSQVWQRYSAATGASFEERMAIILEFYTAPNSKGNLEEYQGIYSRLSYLNAAALAINEYDRGRPSDSLETAWVAFIPRALWPDKPITSEIGREFNILATGNPNSSSAPGIFADAYYCWGWLGVPLVMIPIGIWFFLLGRYTLWVLSTARYLHFPVVLSAMRIGFRVDGFIVTDIIGVSVILCFLMVGAEVGERLLPRMRSRKLENALTAAVAGKRRGMAR